MKNNFNLAGYLKKNTLLNESFEGFGGYRDLNPLNEISQDDLSQDIQKMIAHVKDGEGSIDDDYIEQTWENISDIPFSNVQKQVIGALGKAGLLKSFNEGTDNEAAYFAEDEMQELEKPEKIYADDDGEDDDRFWDNWGKGDQIMSDLKSAGFDVEDVVDFIKSHWHRY